VTPTEFFDQFPPLAEGAPWNTEGQWCPRHWSPCPILGANGMGAAVELMQAFLDEVCPPEVRGAEAMNHAMQATGYLCCTLGDDRMYEIWGHWPPSPKPTTREG